MISVYDDMLVYGESDTEHEAMVDHDENMRALMERCKEQNVTLNKDKMQLKNCEVRFLGHLLTANGVQAITEMPKPTDVQGVQRFLGLINYLSKFFPKLSEVCEPLHVLTLKETEWCWLEAHDKVFEEIKAAGHKLPCTSILRPGGRADPAV